MKKIFLFLLLTVFVFSLPVTALATAGTSGLNTPANTVPYIDWLEGAVFKIQVWNADDTLIYDAIVSEPVYIGAYSKMRIDVIFSSYAPVDNFFISFRNHSSIGRKFFVNGSQVTLNFSGGSRVISYYASFNSEMVESMYFEFTNSPANGTTAIVGLFSNVYSTFDVPTFTVNYDYIASIYTDGRFEYIEGTLDSYLHGDTPTVAFGKTIYPSDLPDPYDLEWFKPRLVIPLSNLNSDFVEYFTFTFDCYGSLADATAFVSRFQTSNYLEGSQACQVNITSIPSTDPVNPGFLENISAFGYQIQINTEGLDLKDKYLHIQLEIDPRSYDSGTGTGFAAYWYFWDLEYTLNLRHSSSLLTKIYASLTDQLNYLFTFEDDLFAIRTELGAFHDTVVVLYNSILDNSSKLDSILDALSETTEIISDIYEWLNNFTPESGSSLDISIDNASSSYIELEQNVQYLETVPKMEVQEYTNQLDTIKTEVFDEVLQASPISDPTFDPTDLSSPAVVNAPLNMTTPIAAFFPALGGSSAVMDWSVIFVLVCTIGLIGYVLFGKR